MKGRLRWGGKALLDLAVLSAAYGLAYLLRFEFEPSLQQTKHLFFTWPYVVLLQYVVLTAHGVPRFAWTFTGLREAYVVLRASASSAAILVAARLVLPEVGGYAAFATIPFGVIGMNFVLSFCGVTGIRGLSRTMKEQEDVRRLGDGPDGGVPTLLIGAGRAGMLVARELLRRPDLGMRPVGFADDDPHKRGVLISGLPVLGAIETLPSMVERTGARQALLCIPSLPGTRAREVSRVGAGAGISVKVIPSLSEVVAGRKRLTQVRNVALADLLRRPPVDLDMAAISSLIRDRVVLVTGAGGSIGSELCRQALGFLPKRLVLVDRSEPALYAIHNELSGVPDADERLVPCIADVADGERIDGILRDHRPSIILHAAAHKHVPMMEWNCAEAVKNNVGGSITLAERSVDRGVERFVLISTDKAVRPTSMMGATKRIAEVCIQRIAEGSATRFTTVRFGNVLGSQGSVVPLFERQIAEGGPVTVTHPDMTRYFMLIPEACQLVLQAATMGGGGEMYVLDMGEPVRIVDLAQDLIELSGLSRGIDIDIVFTGLRPGEKLFEELSRDEEGLQRTAHPAILRGRIDLPPADFAADVQSLLRVARQGDAARTRAMVVDLVPDFTRTSTPGEPASTASPVATISAPVAAGLPSAA